MQAPQTKKISTENLEHLKKVLAEIQKTGNKLTPAEITQLVNQAQMQNLHDLLTVISDSLERIAIAFEMPGDMENLDS